MKKPRIEFDGAIYHVTNKSEPLLSLFTNDRDCEIFLDTVGEVCERMGWKVHAFVLMESSYQLLVETPKANLGKGMQGLQGTYTLRYNLQHKTEGRLFAGAYQALLVDGENGYFSTVANYIHLTPARASCFDLEKGKLSDYRRSSYLGYLRPAHRPEWLTTERIFSDAEADDSVVGRGKYRQQMKTRVLQILQGTTPADIENSRNRIRKDWVLGSEAFKTKILKSLTNILMGKNTSYLSGAAMKDYKAYKAEAFCLFGLKVCGLEGVDLETLRKGDERKAVIAWAFRQKLGLGNIWISNRLKMGIPGTLSKRIRMVEESDSERINALKSMLLEYDAEN